jgi:N-acyl-D-amino-acid deacylase
MVRKAMLLTRRQLLAASPLAFPAILGRAAQATAPLDEAMQGLLAKHALPGGALGIARAGKIVYTQGFGWANREQGEAVRAESRFRLASVSKPVTAAAVLRLCEQGKLTLDEAVLPRLKLKPFTRTLGDPRWPQITVRQLLSHTAGWDKKRSGDALFRSPEICRDLGLPCPADGEATVRWMLGRPLDFDPGSAYAYCNFGYCLLGRLIEAVTGQSYGQAVQKLVLGPVSASRIELGRSLQTQADEVRYYAQEKGPPPRVFPQLPASSWPYGAFSLEANDANGGWIANVGDLLRFVTALDEGSARPLFQRSSLDATYARPPGGGLGKGVHYGLGWLVRAQGQAGRPNLWHTGALPGTLTIAVRLGDGFDWCALFNSRPRDWEGASLDIQNTVHAAARKVWV